MTGYFAYQSCRIDSFVDEFPALFCQKNALSEPIYYVVKNHEMGEWLKRHLADRFGSVLGFRILEIDQAIRKFSDWYMDPYSDAEIDKHTVDNANTVAKTLLFRSETKLAIYKALEEFSVGRAPPFKPIRAYLAKAPHGEESKWLWQFAGSVADAFAFYDSNFPEQWEGSEATWQHRLWERISHAELPYSTLGSKLSKIVTSEKISNSNSARIVILLPGLLGEPAIRFFQYMGREHEIHHLLLMPMWERDPVQTFLFNNSRPARRMVPLCGQMPRPKVIPAKGKIGSRKTLLERLRKSLINDEPVQGTIRDDGSLDIHAVCGPRREIEVLKNLILAALWDDEKLTPAEIAVLAPDISVYAPYIKTIFPSVDSREHSDHLEYELMDLPARTLAPYSRAFKALASLPGSRFGRQALLSLFDNPCFKPTSGRSKLASEWKNIVQELHVRWGSTEEHRREEGVFDLRTGTWESAFERLLAAYYHDEDDSSDLLPARHFGDADTQVAGQLIYVIRSLDAQLRQLHKKNLPLSEWVELWLRITGDWLIAQPDIEDEKHIKKALGGLKALGERLDKFSNQLIPWPVFSALLDELCLPDRIHYSHSSGRGVICATIRSLRCIPFRRIYLLGMNEGSWPSRKVLPGFDLRNTMENYEDFSREAEDRLCFLEVFFAARDNVSLIYDGKDSEFGDRLSPAAPVVELMEHLGEGARTLLKEHPPAPYHFCRSLGEDAEKRGQIDSSLPQHLTMAWSFHEKRKRPAPLPAVLPLKKPDGLNWQVLMEFLSNPVRYFYCSRMGAARPETPDDRDEYDVMEPDYLEWWNWRSSVVLENPESLTSASALVDGFRNHIRREGSVSNTLLGELQAERWLKESELLISGLEDLGEFGSESPFHCRFSPRNSLQSDRLIRAAGTGSRIQPLPGEELCLPAPQVRGEQMLQITGIIRGLRQLPEESDGSVWTMLDFADAQKIGSRHNMRTWIAALMIGSALGTMGPRELRILRLGRGAREPRRYFFYGDSKERDSISMTNSRELLETLLEVFWAGQKEPIPLYPELADRIAILNRKMAVAGDGLERKEGNLVKLAERAWNELVASGGDTPNRVQSCYYRKYFLGPPDFSSEIFTRAWKEIYLGGGLLPARG